MAITFTPIQVPDWMLQKAYRHGKLLVLVSMDEGRWHLSISHKDRLPTWDEISQARRQLLPPDLHFCIPHPPEKFWVNIHPNCLHLWEVRDKNLTDIWEQDGRQIRAAGLNGKPSW